MLAVKYRNCVSIAKYNLASRESQLSLLQRSGMKTNLVMMIIIQITLFEKMY